MDNSHQISLTKKQADKLSTFIDSFYSRAQVSNAIPVPMMLLLGGVRRAVKEEDALDQIHIDVLLWALELIFHQMGEDEYDPLLEQVWQKLAGWWPVQPPWYERIINK